jgi:hypothetical protein
MNATNPSEARELSLVEIIDFKWLMGMLGHGVHVERLQNDREYARQCLMCGAQAEAPALRNSARRLAQAMGICIAAGGP